MSDKPSVSGGDPRLIPGPPGRGVTPRRLLRLMSVGCCVLPLATRPLASWAEHLPDAAAPLHDAVLAADAATAEAGLTAPYDALHAVMQRWIAAPFFAPPPNRR